MGLFDHLNKSISPYWKNGEDRFAVVPDPDPPKCKHTRYTAYIRKRIDGKQRRVSIGMYCQKCRDLVF